MEQQRKSMSKNLNHSFFPWNHCLFMSLTTIRCSFRIQNPLNCPVRKSPWKFDFSFLLSFFNSWQWNYLWIDCGNLKSYLLTLKKIVTWRLAESNEHLLYVAEAAGLNAQHLHHMNELMNWEAPNDQQHYQKISKPNLMSIED